MICSLQEGLKDKERENKICRNLFIYPGNQIFEDIYNGIQETERYTRKFNQNYDKHPLEWNHSHPCDCKCRCVSVLKQVFISILDPWIVSIFWHENEHCPLSSFQTTNLGRFFSNQISNLNFDPPKKEKNSLNRLRRKEWKIQRGLFSRTSWPGSIRNTLNKSKYSHLDEK